YPLRAPGDRPGSRCNKSSCSERSVGPCHLPTCGPMTRGRTVRGWRRGRREAMAGAIALWPSLALGQRQANEQGPPPIVFVHGNGDSSALWINNLWRFEANNYKRSHLFAIDFTDPVARRDDSKPEPDHSSSDDEMKELAGFVSQVRGAV